MKKICLFGLILLLAGCASMKQQKINDAMLKATLEAQDCGELSPKTAVHRSQCIGQVYKSNLQEADYQYMPLLDMLLAKNDEAAARYEAKKITLSEYEAIMKHNWADFQLSESQLIASDQQRRAAAWQAFSQNMQMQQMQNQMMLNNNRMRTTNCNQFGNSLNCYSY